MTSSKINSSETPPIALVTYRDKACGGNI